MCNVAIEIITPFVMALTGSHNSSQSDISVEVEEKAATLKTKMEAEKLVAQITEKVALEVMTE